jgi:hypothetical protein
MLRAGHLRLSSTARGPARTIAAATAPGLTGGLCRAQSLDLLSFGRGVRSL